mgnify:CR=1 FL=1
MTKKTKIRPIVRAAFRVNELVYQFEDIDVPDGHLETGSIEEVNERYDDVHIICEARHRLDIAMDDYNQEDKWWRRDAAQLRRFIAKWETPESRAIAVAHQKSFSELVAKSHAVDKGETK